MTRRLTAYSAILAIAALLVFDMQTTPPNPYAAPSLFALGSGVTATGGFCGALPN